MNRKLQDTIIRRILSIAGERRLKGYQLAKMAGVAPNTWSEIQSLKRPLMLDVLERLCAALKVEVTVSIS